MKTLGSVVLSSVVLATTMSFAVAAETQNVRHHKSMTVNKGIAQYDINPFIDQKRMLQNERLKKSLSKSESNTSKQKRVVANDGVSFATPQVETNSNL